MPGNDTENEQSVYIHIYSPQSSYQKPASKIVLTDTKVGP